MKDTEKQQLTDLSNRSVSDDDSSLVATTNNEHPQYGKSTLLTSEIQSLYNGTTINTRLFEQDHVIDHLYHCGVCQYHQKTLCSLCSNNIGSATADESSMNDGVTDISKQSQHTPFISMKSLRRLTPAKYQWSEPQRNGTPSKEHTSNSWAMKVLRFNNNQK
jgi:hypothetical protein